MKQPFVSIVLQYVVLLSLENRARPWRCYQYLTTPASVGLWVAPGRGRHRPLGTPAPPGLRELRAPTSAVAAFAARTVPASEHRAPSRAQARPGSASRLDDESTVRVGPGSEAIFLRPNERSLGWLERQVGSADEARGQETRQKQRHARQAGQPKGPHSPPSRCPGRSRRRAVRARRNSCSDGHSAAAAGRESDKRDAPCGDWRGRPPVLAFQ